MGKLKLREKGNKLLENVIKNYEYTKSFARGLTTLEIEMEHAIKRVENLKYETPQEMLDLIVVHNFCKTKLTKEGWL